MLKQLRKNKAFSIIEIIIALVFSSVLLTTFISLSAWGLNSAKNNEIEDTSTQSLEELNDLLRSPSILPITSVSSDLPITTPRYYYMNYAIDATPAKRNTLSKISDISYTLDALNLAACRGNPAYRVIFKDTNSALLQDNFICVVAKITKLSNIPLDNRYLYTIKVVAEKSNDESYTETIDGMRVGPFTLTAPF